MNQCTLMGRTGQDVRVTRFQDGGAVGNVSLATDESYKDRDGSKVERTEWHNLVINNKLVDVFEKYVPKGRMILVQGKLRMRSWDDRDGNKKYITEIMVYHFEFAGSDGNREESGSRPQSPKADDSPAAWEEKATADSAADLDDEINF